MCWIFNRFFDSLFDRLLVVLGSRFGAFLVTKTRPRQNTGTYGKSLNYLGKITFVLFGRDLFDNKNDDKNSSDIQRSSRSLFYRFWLKLGVRFGSKKWWKIDTKINTISRSIFDTILSAFSYILRRPGGMREAAGGLKESERSWKFLFGVLNTPCTSQARAADLRAQSRLPATVLENCDGL